MLKVIIDVVTYGLGIYYGLHLILKHGDKLKKYFNDILEGYPKMPQWLNWTLGIVLFLCCIIVQIIFFKISLIFWLFLLIIVPITYIKIKNRKIINSLQVILFFICTFYAIVLFVNIDDSRDLIGKSLLPNYRVYYKTESVQVDYYDLGTEDKEKEIAYVHTGNKNADFFFEKIFPVIFRLIIALLFLASLFINISIMNIINKNKMISENINK